MSTDTLSSSPQEPSVVEDSDAMDTSQLLTPSLSYSSGKTSPTLNEPSESMEPTSQKKKKKKKSKKSAKAKEAVLNAQEEARPSVLCISRNKHWRYISSYHGPWLQLPVELLESLLLLNLDPATLAPNEPRIAIAPSSQTKPRDRGLQNLSNHSSCQDPPGQSVAVSSPHSIFPSPKPGRPSPPPIDPGVFRSVTSIRRLIDEAAELSVRATAGMSTTNKRGGGSAIGVQGNNARMTAQAFGLSSSGDNGGGSGSSRNGAMSAMRIHRLRVQAVQKLAQAYRTDEIASSVMVMQGGSVFDNLAERVLKVDENDVDAKYVHFFHEKIPSRLLAESTTTQVLDELIATEPTRLEFYRTRGTVHSFRDEYPQAIKDFTHALKEVRVARRARAGHRAETPQKAEVQVRANRRWKVNGQAPPNGTGTLVSDSTEGEPQAVHPSVLPDAPEPLELQVLFLRGAAFLQHAMFLIEEAMLRLEGVRKGPTLDGAELRLCHIEGGRYGGVEMGHPDGPLGPRDGEKLKAYRRVLADAVFREQVCALVKKSLRDHEKFLSHFETLEGPNVALSGDLARRVEYAFRLTESNRPGHHAPPPHIHSHVQQTMFTTYHPLLVESHFSMLIGQLMLADFSALLPTFVRTATLVDALEGYPVFLPPRSMAQAEFVEVLERLAGGWRNGRRPHSSSGYRAGKLAIEPAPDPARFVDEPAADPHAPSTSTAGASEQRTMRSSQMGTPTHLVEALDCLRILLAPVAAQQRERAEKAAAEKAGGKKKPMQINIPLHGPKVEIILAWLAAVHLVELDSVA